VPPSSGGAHISGAVSTVSMTSAVHRHFLETKNGYLLPNVGAARKIGALSMFLHLAGDFYGIGSVDPS